MSGPFRHELRIVKDGVSDAQIPDMFEALNGEGSQTVAELFGRNTPHQRAGYFISLHEESTLGLGARDLRSVLGVDIGGDYERAAHRGRERERFVALAREAGGAGAQSVKSISQAPDPGLRRLNEVRHCFTTHS